MANQNPIDITLCRRIAYEEWRNFKKSQDKAIDERVNRETGLIHSGGAGRRYSISTNKQEIIASLLHPDYERYLDIKKLKTRKTKSKLHTPKTYKTGGKKIHNALIWGRMNTIAFRCMNDLRGEVIKFLRSSKIAKRDIRIEF